MGDDMAHQIIKGIRRELRKRVPLAGPGTGFTTEPDGEEEADLEVVVDMAWIAQKLGHRAMKNKTGRARYLGGAVIVNVVRRERVKA